jgi:GNAT superfamily N-acetyltransferase
MLSEILAAAALGDFPPPDGGLTILPQPSGRDAGVIAFTAHSVVFLDEDPQWIRTVLKETPCDPLAAPMHPGFLSALLARTGRRTDTIDLLTVASALEGSPPLPLTELTGPAHSRVRTSLARRDEVRAWSADGGVVVLGRGVAGRWEVAIEVDESLRHHGLGRQLAMATRHLIPTGAHVWSQQSPGNARSVRTFQAAGYRPIGSELLLRESHITHSE